MTLDEICEVLALPATGASVLVEGVVSDSRLVRPGHLFVCILGENLDGHDFVDKAVQAGAVAILASRPLTLSTPVPVLEVPDTIKAFGTLAHAWRCRFSGKVAGITGTAGKTTVKEVLAQVLDVRGSTARNPLNLNNQIGMPLAMLDTTGEELFWVMEAGISQAQDMEELAPVLSPDVALVLNAGVGHTEGLGGKGVAWHKAQMLSHARRVALVSADYPELAREARAARRDTVFFSTAGQPVPYRGAYTGPAPDGERGIFRLWLDGLALEVTAPFRGAYGAENTIAVAAVAHIFGLTPAEITQGLAAATLPRQRFETRRTGEWQIIDDSYNANPLSMWRMVEAAVDVAGALPVYGMLGEMRELGDVAEAEHEKLGRMLGRSGMRAIFWKGKYFTQVRDGLQAEKWNGPLYVFDSAESFLRCWQEAALKPGLVLCKGSRGNKLEEVLAALEGAHVL